MEFGFRTKRLFSFAATVMTALAIAVLWSSASPTSSAPDEPAHLIYAWGLATGQGPNGDQPPCDQVTGECYHALYDVPDGAILGANCHKFDRRNSGAGCARVESPALTNLARYPPPFYVTIGTSMRLWIAAGGESPAAPNIARLTAALISFSMLLLSTASLKDSQKELGGAVVVLLTPMTLFLVGSANPSGVEIAAGLSAAVAVVAASHGPSRLSGAALAWSMFWLALSRPIGWLWATVLLTFALVWLSSTSGRLSVSTLRKTIRTQRRSIGVSVLWIALGIAWFVFAIQERNTQNDVGVTIPETTTGRTLAIVMRWGDMSSEAVGLIGWLDTPLPAILLLTIFAAVVATVALGFVDTVSSSRRILNSLHLVGLLALITFIMERQSFLWQGRYAMPPFAAALVFVISEARQRSRHAIHLFAQVSWAFTSASSVWIYARYAWGIQNGPRFQIPNFTNPTPWESPLTTEFFLVLSVLAWLAGAGIVFRLLHGPTNLQTTEMRSLEQELAHES